MVAGTAFARGWPCGVGGGGQAFEPTLVPRPFPSRTASLGVAPLTRPGSRCPGMVRSHRQPSPVLPALGRGTCAPACEGQGCARGLAGGRASGAGLLRNRSAFLQHVTDVKCITTLV